MKLKSTVVSDWHLDFWLKPGRTKIGGSLERVLNTVLHKEEDVEVLIIAGDLTHYPSQLKEIEMIAKMWNYKKVFCVLGNHELYLVSQSQVNRHKTSKHKVQEYYDYAEKSEIITILDGVVEEYKGVKFGGAMSWYDGSYLQEASMYGTSVVQEWKNTMNDARLIKGYDDFYDIWIQELPKIKDILDCDVVITHVCPITEAIGFQEPYRHLSSSKFYAFNGEKFLQETRAKYWVFGHSHGTHEFEVHDVKCVMNTIGYPGEQTYQKVLIEI